jgi:uncharacterized protein
MSNKLHDLVVEAGGEIAGKVRFQKIVYLLDQLGFESGFEFEYHHYGPYSAELTDAISDEISFGNIDLQEKRRKSDGVPYIVYKLANHNSKDGGSIRELNLSSAIAAMQAATATVLELAATAHWLAVYEKKADWELELRKRKGVKIEGGRDKLAFELLRNLHLSPMV